MSTDKPSKNEDEYFAREDAERIRKLREKDTAERVAEERRSHHMKCPKCGATLKSESIRGIEIDKCPECRGLWLDHGELDALGKLQDPGLFNRVVGDLFGSLKKDRPGR